MNWRRMKTKKIHLNHETPILLLIVFSFLLISFLFVKRLETYQYEKQVLEIIHKRNVENRKKMRKVYPVLVQMKWWADGVWEEDSRNRKKLFWRGKR